MRRAGETLREKPINQPDVAISFQKHRGFALG